MRIFFLFLLLLLSGCNSSLERNDATQYDKGSFSQLTKTDFDRMADYEIKENTQSLKILALKFYKRNPAELRKTTSDSPEVTVNWLFSNSHSWKFKEINNAQGIEALDQVFDENFNGDRVLSLIAGLYTMLITAHDNQKEFDMFDSLDPQLIYNAARNVEVIVWRLSTKRKKNGKLFLVTNEMNDNLQNLTFEREFGKIIGRTDYFAYVLSEKKERYITRAIQGTTIRVLLPFL
ncbi:MAG: hypothetical protein HOF49_01825 [Nitrosomonadales bacterium]|jgi:uncharacterized protein YceK|nr:hypothetical protein [Nitrosomonadales bacterium]MBT5572690.1 hypothetical protein [Nitrosomonadales bacterium]MBT6015191.1 hypothetical protein [Nitrosomonadales bacterium]MBT6251585.1 hypothetical protein [Nitrosomonadales bacterium]MBT6818109.1 hypothetical protein [Nitrosomonadales bacterium]